MKRSIQAAALAAVSLSVAAAAQPPANPYARPVDLGPSDKAIPSALDQIADGTRAASDARAAAAARRAGGPARPAKPGEIVAGAALSDSAGVAVGTIEQVESDGAVVATAAGKVKVPLDAFGKNKAGLLIGMKKTEFDALVAKANAG